MILKFFIFILVIVVLALVGVGLIFRRIKNMFGIKNNSKFNSKKAEKDDNVIYQKDDVVVLKGEAEKNKKEYND